MRQDTPSALYSRRLVVILLVSALGGCATLGGDSGQPLVPTKYERRTGPFAVFTGMPIAADSAPIRSLRSLEHDLGTGLGLRASTEGPPVEVYVLRDREAFTHFLTFYYPELPPRRAFFLAQGPRRVIYTFHNDRLEEDLRHEATHALLHVAVGDLPLWLDEGLAEYFEGPDAARQGVNPEHVARLPDDLKAGWRPDLERLEALKSVGEMTPRDYRESWAWVHFLLNGPAPGKAALLAELADLSAHPKTAESLSLRLSRLQPAPPGVDALLTHIDRVRSAPAPSPAPVASVSPVVDPTVLLQNSPLTPPRRGLFGRFLTLIGLAAQ